MNVRITRPVVVSTAAGLRHFMPGLIVSISDPEAAFVLRQQAGVHIPSPQKARQKPVETRAENKAETPHAPA